MWGLAGSQIEPVSMSPALPDGFLTTGPPRKSSNSVFRVDVSRIDSLRVFCGLYLWAKGRICSSSLWAMFCINMGFPGGSDSKESACQCRRQGFLSLDWEDPLKKKMATHSSVLAWEILWTEELGRLQSMWPQRVVHDWATNTCINIKLSWFIKRCPCCVG